MKKVIAMLSMALFLAAVTVPYASAAVKFQEKTTSVVKKHKKAAAKKNDNATSESAAKKTDKK